MVNDDGRAKAAAISPTLPPHLAAKIAGPSSDTVIGPTIPPHLDAQPVRRVLGPTMPPSQDEDEPKISAAAQAFLEREKRMKEALDRQEAGLPPLSKEKNSRPDWMLALPTSQSFSESLQKDPSAALKNRGFSQAQNARVQKGRGGAGLGGTGEKDTSLWTETPQEREKRLMEEEMGIKPKASEVSHVENEEEREKRKAEQEREAMLQRAIREHNDQRGPTLLEQHQAKRRSEMRDKDKKRDKSDSSSKSRRRRDDSISDSEEHDRKHRRREESSKHKRREKYHSQSDSESLSEDEKRRERRRERHRGDEKSERDNHGKHCHHRSSHHSDSKDREREVRRKEKEREKKKKRKEREREEKEEKKGAPMMVWDREAAMSMGGKLMDNQKRTETIRSAAGLGNRFGSGTTRYL